MKRNNPDGTVSLEWCEMVARAEDHAEEMIEILEEAVYDIEAHAKQAVGIKNLQDCNPRDRKRYDQERVVAREIRDFLSKVGYQVKEVSE
jgi:hypothetical protein